ncbi:MAG: Crp/Fnr family transcriptional regulator [Acidobacteria bacterium]|nr:Crp/Fnr family transcriptional regulator [Acidobacteriota bacterium]
MRGTNVTTAAAQRSAKSFPSLRSLPHVERTFWRGATIYSSDDAATHIYSVIGGRVKIQRTSADGQQKITSIRYGGDLFGELALAGVATAQYGEEAVALDTVGVALIRVEDFWRAALQNGALAGGVFDCLTARLDEALRQIESLVFENNSRRLMRVLFDLAGEAARAGEASVRLTHEEIAGLIGSAREVVTGLMLDLRRRGLIDYKRGEICPCLPKLAHFLREEPCGERF